MERPLKVAHINTEALSWIFFVGQGDYMRTRGIESHAISSDGDYLRVFQRIGGMTIHRVELTRSITPLRDLVSVVRLWRTLRRIRPDVVEAHTTKAGLVGMVAAWLARVPVRIYHNHGIAVLSAEGLKRRVLWLSDRVSARLATEVIYVAPSVRDAAVREALCPPAKARCILSINGLDFVQRFNPARVEPGTRARVRENLGIPADALVLGFAGRLFRVKGVAELAAAWRVIAVRFPTAHLLIAGEFDDRVPLGADVVAALRSDLRIHLAGYVHDMPSLYLAMDVLTLPSYHEGLGYVLIEASAMGIPTIGTRIPGIVDAVLDGQTGTLIDPVDVAQLIAAVDRYFRSPALRSRHGEAGRRYVEEHFSQPAVWEQLYRTYRRLTSDGVGAADQAPG